MINGRKGVWKGAMEAWRKLTRSAGAVTREGTWVLRGCQVPRGQTCPSATQGPSSPGRSRGGVRRLFWPRPWVICPLTMKFWGFFAYSGYKTLVGRMAWWAWPEQSHNVPSSKGPASVHVLLLRSWNYNKFSGRGPTFSTYMGPKIM